MWFHEIPPNKTFSTLFSFMIASQLMVPTRFTSPVNDYMNEAYLSPIVLHNPKKALEKACTIETTMTFSTSILIHTIHIKINT